MAAKPNEPRHFYSLDEYFALEHAGEARYEYWDGDIVCMSGGSRAHGLIASNTHYRLRQRLEGGACVAFTADTAVQTPSLLPYRYPDVSVACPDPKFENIRGVDALINPILVVEVLSPTTAQRDAVEKFAAYRAIPSFKEYLLVAQDALRIVHHFLRADGKWDQDEVTDLGATLTLRSISCEMTAREVYEGGDLRQSRVA